MSRGDARSRVSDLAGSCSRQLTHEHVYTYNQSWTFWGILRRRRAGSSRVVYPVPKAVSLIRNLPGRYRYCQVIQYAEYAASTLGLGVRSELQPSASYETSTGAMLEETFTLVHAFILYKFTVHCNRVK